MCGDGCELMSVHSVEGMWSVAVGVNECTHRGYGYVECGWVCLWVLMSVHTEELGMWSVGWCSCGC